MAMSIEQPSDVSDCGKCGKRAVRPSPSGQFTHCFACGLNNFAQAQTGLSEALNRIASELHSNLNSNQTLVEELGARYGLHRQVLVDSAVGLMPEDFDVSQRLLPVIQSAREGLEVLENSRGKGRPTKEEKAKRETLKQQIEEAKRAQDALTEFVSGQPGSLTFSYTNLSGELVRLGAMAPRTGNVTYVELGSTPGVFNHALFAAGVQPQTLAPLRGWNLILASELELLQLQSVAARIAVSEGMRPEQGYLPAFAVGMTDIDASAARRLGPMPLFLRTGGKSTRDNAVVAALREELNLFSSSIVETIGEPAGESGDIDTVETIAAGVKRRVLVTRPFRAVRDEIDFERLGEKKANKFLVDRIASAILVRDVTERGQLFYDGRQAYVHDPEKTAILPVDRDDVEAQLFLTRYGVAPGDAFAKQALNGIRLRAQQTGVITRIHNLSHYDRERHLLYLFTHGTTMIRIGPDSVEEVPNGTDGVLFLRNRKAEPFKLLDDGRHQWGDVLLGGMRFRQQELTRTEQRELIEMWFYSLFFPELFPTRPILAMVGEKGSGKTSVLRRMGQLLFGAGFQVMGMSHEQKDFDAAITGEAFVAIDNADTGVSWLEDRLAVVATGGTLKRRRLYTTNDMVEYPVTAFVAVTSRTPHFRREDIADRLLPFHLERLEQFEAENVQLANLQQSRNEIMTAVVRRLQKIVAALEESEGRRYPTTFRMADFAQFALTIADADGRLEEMKSILQRAAREQLAFSTQDDPVLEVIEHWLEAGKNLNREVTTAELFSELRDLSRTSSPTLAFDFKSARAFGVYLAGANREQAAEVQAQDALQSCRRR